MIPDAVRKAVDDGSFVWLPGRDGLQVWCSPTECDVCHTARALFIVRQTIDSADSRWDCRCFLCVAPTEPHKPTAAELHDIFRPDDQLAKSTAMLMSVLKP